MYPQLMTSFLSTQKKNLGSINGNLAYIVLSRIGNFEEIIRDESKKSETRSLILNKYDQTMTHH